MISQLNKLFFNQSIDQDKPTGQPQSRWCTATLITHYFASSEIRWRCTGHYSRWSGDFEKTTQNHRGLALV
jgi:hypothetical protein